MCTWVYVHMGICAHGYMLGICWVYVHMGICWVYVHMGICSKGICAHGETCLFITLKRGHNYY